MAFEVANETAGARGRVEGDRVEHGRRAVFADADSTSVDLKRKVMRPGCAKLAGLGIRPANRLEATQAKCA